MELDSFLAELGIENTQQPQEVSDEEALDSLVASLNGLQESIDRFQETNTEPVTTEEANNPVEETQETINNEPTLKKIQIYNDDSARFSGAEWFDAITNQKAAIIGLGGIGSWLTLLLSRLKLSAIYCQDMDTVESVNLAGQLYNNSHIGMFKTQALRDIVSQFNRYRPYIYTDNSEFTTDSRISLVAPFSVFLALDSITARKNVYNYWKKKQSLYSLPSILIDGRLTADKWQIFAIPFNDKKRMKVYEEEWLFPESEAQQLRCSFKQTTYMAAMIASYMCNLFVNYVAECTKPIVPYSVPFMTEFDAQTLTRTIYECD